jgi:TRAP-type C4-dicarboxylate transport system permease small subunit
MVLDVSWQVFTRFIMNHPSSFTEELATFLMIWIGLLGGAYALRQKAHLGIDILTIRLSHQKRCMWEFFIYTMVILIAILVFIWGGVRLVNITLYLNQISAALRVKMGYVYTVLPITGVLLIIYSIYFMVEAYEGLKTQSQVISTQKE